MNFLCKEKQAFTIAELLITISIIGIVAGIVIPTVITSSEEKSFKEAFKRDYADIAAATQQIMNNNGGTMKDAFDPCPYWGGNPGIYTTYSRYLDFIKGCWDRAGTNGCWHNFGYPVGFSTEDSPGAILKNGSLILFTMRSDQCTDSYCCPTVIPSCASIYVDVNGFKKPNRFGKDIFFIHVLEDGIKPYGTTGETDVYNTCAKGGSGAGCAQKVLMGIDYSL